MRISQLSRKLMPIGLVALSAFASVPADAQITQKGDAYLFRMKWTKGQKVNYNIAINTKMGAGAPKGAPGAMTMNMPFSMHCTDVKNNVFTINAKIGPMTGVPGMKPGDSTQNMTIKMDNRGKTVGGSMGGQSLSQVGLSQSNYPEKPIKVGQSWSADLPNAAPGMSVKGTYTLRGIKTVNGKQVAEIAMKLSASNAQMKMSGGGVMLALMSDGTILSMKSTQSMTIGAAGGSKPMKMDMTMNLSRK